MKKNIKDNNGLNSEDFLPGLRKDAFLYTVPPGYFENLAGAVSEKIQAEGFTKKSGYRAPSGYFDNFSAEILQKIKEAAGSSRQDTGEQEEETHLLSGISKAEVYTVPENYFGNFPSKITDRIKEPAKVVELKPGRNFWRMAVAAAAVLGILLCGEWYLNHSGKKGAMHTPDQYANVINVGNDSFQNNLSGLSEDEILRYLSTPDPFGDDNIDPKAVDETKKAISELTSEELENYLNRTPATTY